MANERRDGYMGLPSHNGASSGEALERTLRLLGPLLHRRAHVGPPRPAFVCALRARLLTRGAGAPPSGHQRRHGTRGRRVHSEPPTMWGDVQRRPMAVVGLMGPVLLLAVLALGAIAGERLELALTTLIVLVLAVLIVIVALIAE